MNKCTEWEKIFADQATDKGIISKIHKQLVQVDVKKKKSNQKMARRSRYFSKEDIQMVKTHEKMLNIANY